MGTVRLLSSDSSQNPVILAMQIITIYFLSVFNRIRTSGGPREGSRTFGPGLEMPRLVMLREFLARGHHYEQWVQDPSQACSTPVPIPKALYHSWLVPAVSWEPCPSSRLIVAMRRSGFANPGTQPPSLLLPPPLYMPFLPNPIPHNAP